MKLYQKILLVTLAVGSLGFLSFVLIKNKKLFRKVKVKNKNPKRILIVGDSQAAIQTEGGTPITYTYPNILRALNPDKTIDVVAIGGKRTEWMVNALSNKLQTNKYDRIYIHGGGNDTSSATPLETTLNNFQAMVNAATSNGADAFVVLGYKIEGEAGRFGNPNIMPTTVYVQTPEQWKPFIEKRKELQKRLPNTIQNANFVSVYDLKGQTSDGIHPNAEGHKTVSSYIQKSIESD